METRPLGKSGIHVSELSFGTVSLGIPYGIGVNGEEQMPSEQEAVDVLRAALDRGVTLFDTARAYGCSEERVGKAFKGCRADVVVCTKCSSLYDAEGKLPDSATLKATIDHSLKQSLNALQTDYVDVFMVHNGDLNILACDDIAEAFAGYRKAGIARAIGVSTYSVEETRTAIQRGVWDMIQLPYNLMDQRQGALFGMAARHGVGLIVRSVLFKGILTDRGRHLHPELRAVEAHRERYGELLNAAIPGLSDLATKFVLSRDEVSSVLVGIDKMEYLDQALAVADGRYLDAAALARAAELEYPDPDFLDLRTWDRNGWLT